MNYSPQQIAAVLDYACLNPNAGNMAIVNGANFCEEHNIKCFCVASANVYLAAGYHHNVASVIGFPHGNMSPRAKLEEAKQAVSDGARELDVVVNYGRFNNGDWGIIKEELGRLTTFAHHHNVLVKAILETCTMDVPTITAACEECIEAEVDFVKTSTGFGSYGARKYAVQAMLDAVKGTGIKVKASGGIKTYKDAELYLNMGCKRLGTSRYEELLPCETD
jgi:deoxyribose-phosphate aldolase